MFRYFKIAYARDFKIPLQTISTKNIFPGTELLYFPPANKLPVYYSPPLSILTLFTTVRSFHYE
jgi:hypothetical protein